MYKSFKIKNFRGFEELEIEDIQRINLIAGLNNVGKTALLEAIFLHCGASNPNVAIHLNLLRGIEPSIARLTQIPNLLLESLFFKLDTSMQVELEGTDGKGQKRWLRLRIAPPRERLVKIDSTASEKGLLGQDAKDSFGLSNYDTLELECQEKEKTEIYRLVVDPQGLLIKPSPPPPPFLAQFLCVRRPIPLSADAEWFGKLEIEGRQDMLLDALKIIEPKIRRLAVVTRAGLSVIHGDIGIGRLIPLPIMGEGMVRICSLILAIANIPDGVVLIDEIENGIHHSVMGKLWKAIGEIARKFNTQIFATTHSYECIVAAHKAFSEGSTYDFCLYRLDEIDKKIKCISYNQETLATTIENEWEVR